MTVRLEGLEEVQNNLRQWGINADNELSQIVRATTLAVHAEATQSIHQGTKSGRVYPKYNERGERVGSHTASAPGEAPASDTGRLAGSINANFPSPLSGVVFTPLEYGAHLEFGTQTIQPRPWLFPALESQRAPWIKRLNRVTEKAAKGITRL